MSAENSAFIRVTVGICAFNEDNNIGHLLDNVLNHQALSLDSEVIVVCSGCTDNTVKIVGEHAQTDLRVNLIVEQTRKGKASAVNKILSKARNDVIIFVSADTLPQKNSFTRLVRRIQKSSVGIVCGNPTPMNSSKLLVGRLVQLLWRFHGYVFAELNDAGLARHATELFCIRKGIVEKIPAGVVNDDAFIAVTAKKKGWLIKFDSKAGVSICGPSTFKEFFQQRRRIMFGHCQIKKLTGEPPQHLLYLIPHYPVKVFKLCLNLAREHDTPTVLAFLFTEFSANLAAIIDTLSGKSHRRWTTLPSTKNLVNGNAKTDEIAIGA